MSICDHCKELEAKIILTYEQGTEHLCFRCYNKMMEEELGMELESHPDSFSVTDFAGVSRSFVITSRLNPMGIYLEAEENTEDGYKFAVYGEIDCNQSGLLNQLLDKVMRGVSTSYLTTTTFPSGRHIESIAEGKLIGRLDYDETNEDTPLVIVDGKAYTWEQLGRMVRAFEGFQFQLKMVDMTDDVE
ncbi:DUF7713 domain-containing protein [Alkalihalobacterium alkalinitrilicum]|uniref:DUF7713 domain-containing protein n=1 Tax=Alkalihalobacterium alkalinitrilicum TaxID=427920 RepID=UPI0009952D78|nr:hypothetical protein [Alkalihalobacterium alkalinitrilicum]